ncbi:hypothetical protein H5410_047990 [Solanum commersonii]|uniref:Uncharacterized protein n=1 Tax=Solanum commersonii TaxID=4109 RepID=A0A9J5XJU6_SOLCO|nr:hypothetical protein H5410_047990 [Solanum commersonii]
MESTSSSASPFQRTVQPHTIDKSTGNVPRRVFRQQGQDKHVIPIPNPYPNRDRLVPDTERINTERDRIDTSSRRDSSGNNNVTRSLSFREEDYGEYAYYQDAQDPNEDDDSGMSFDSIALHNLDT